jgi:hypothetical protein
MRGYIENLKDALRWIAPGMELVEVWSPDNKSLKLTLNESEAQKEAPGVKLLQQLFHGGDVSIRFGDDDKTSPDGKTVTWSAHDHALGAKRVATLTDKEGTIVHQYPYGREATLAHELSHSYWNQVSQRQHERTLRQVVSDTFMNEAMVVGGRTQYEGGRGFVNYSKNPFSENAIRSQNGIAPRTVRQFGKESGVLNYRTYEYAPSGDEHSYNITGLWTPK